MKTLDEVISRLEPVAEHNTMWFDEHHCIVGETTVKDALHYLKEYRMQVDDIVAKRKALEYKSKRYDEMCETIQKQGQEHEDRVQAEIARYLEAVRNCELAENKYKKLAEEASQNLVNTSQNEPLTWDELRAMGGKPVWVEIENSVCKKGWFLINYCSGNELHLISINGSSYFLRDFSDTWQAYRKERG